MPAEWGRTVAECGGRKAASGGEERAQWKGSHVQKSKCALVFWAEVGLASGSLHPPLLSRSLLLSLSLGEWLSLCFSVTRSPQPIKCGELVVNFSLPHTQTHFGRVVIALLLQFTRQLCAVNYFFFSPLAHCSMCYLQTTEITRLHGIIFFINKLI